MSAVEEPRRIPAMLRPNARYRLENLTRGVVLSPAAAAACTFTRRVSGLLGRRSMSAADALIFPHCRSVHTWFMRMPIDILALAPDGTVLRSEASVGPWRMIGPVPGAWGIAELPAGTLAGSATASGDRTAIVRLADHAGQGA